MTPTRKTGSRSQLLEACIDSLHALNFHIYDSYAAYKRAEIVNDRYVIRNFPHASPYGTPGKKEGLIVSGDAAPGWFVNGTSDTKAIVEAKFQDSSGSVDEKIPFIYECFKESPIPNWIVVFDGRYWRTGRGQAAVRWLENQPEIPGRKLYVVGRAGFRELVRSVWGTQKA